VGLDNSAESPLPVRTVARSIAEWGGRRGRVWVEGQVAQLTLRPGTVFLTLRDPVADVSLSVTCARGLFDSVVPPLTEGARIVLHGQPVVHLLRGSLQLQALDIRPVGIGELLARLERLKGVLRAEGLFDADRKKPLPFLPRTVGLVTGRDSAAERDVLENARRRWPAVRFDVRGVAVQGHLAVEQCIAAISSLDREPEVDVIVLARGGGSVEDLLPFSDEALCRAVAACRTPVVSAIGHEPDSPLVDAVADVRCSTPTDAGKRVVPDYAEEVARVGQLRDRARRVVVGVVQRELTRLDAMRSRPLFADPQTLVSIRSADVLAFRDRSRRCMSAALDRASHDLDHTRARVVALSPKATLDRGYAVVHDASGAVVRDPADVSTGDELRIRVSAGELEATVR
jgi:exodeoxyribonuclease VII large subunit